MTHRWRLVVCLGLAACGTGAQSGAQTFQTGIVGSAPAGRMHPATMMNAAGVRTLILRMVAGPVLVGNAQQLVQADGYTVDEVVAGGLARRDLDRLQLAVNYLSAEDQRLIARHARAYGAELAELIVSHRPALEAAVAPHASTDERRLALLYFLVGCVALDWEGLSFTAARGYRTAATVTGPGYAYTPWMKENTPDISRRGLYWGSHNRSSGSHTFTTFGDHDALPRRALPDVAVTDTALTAMSAVLRAIHRGAHTPERIAAVSGVVSSQLPDTLARLREIGYIQTTGDDVRLQMTVIEPEVAPAAAHIVTIVREVMDAWHSRRWPTVRRDLGALSALQQGVPFEVVYSEIWHYVFGYANYFLAERGLIADPYRADAPFRGFVPYLWADAIYPAR